MLSISKGSIYNDSRISHRFKWSNLQNSGNWFKSSHAIKQVDIWFFTSPSNCIWLTRYFSYLKFRAFILLVKVSKFCENRLRVKSWQRVLMGKKWAYTGGASYAIYRQIPEQKRSLDISPILLMKAQKNEVFFFYSLAFHFSF